MSCTPSTIGLIMNFGPAAIASRANQLAAITAELAEAATLVAIATASCRSFMTTAPQSIDERH